MQNLCLDIRDVHSSSAHRINQNRLKESVVPMNAQNEAKLTVMGNTKIFIVPPPPVSKEEFERRIGEVKAAGWAIIREMIEKNSLSK